MIKTMLAVLLMAVTQVHAVKLVESGKSDYVIVLPADASPSQKRGAHEIQQHIEQMSGAKLPITDGSSQTQNQIVLTTAQAADDLGNDGFVIKTIGPKVLIVGSKVRGTMYGCTELLEKLGVRWYTPKVTKLPKTADLSLPDDLNEKQVPDFEYREPFFTEAQEKNWAARLRVVGDAMNLDESTGGKIKYAQFVHTLDNLIPRELYKTHPEYFPMWEKKRIDGYVQRCLSNPAVIKLAIDGVNKAFKEHPESMITSVSQNDVDKWCTCPECTKLAEKYGGQSGVYVWFVNQVAEQVEKTYPDHLIDTLAYQFTEAPPKGITPRKNVRIRLCPISCCEAHPYEQCEAAPNKAFLQRLYGWAKITDGMYIWHYNTDFGHYLMPFPDFAEFPAEARLYKKNGVKGIFWRSAPGGGGSDAELRSYVMAKLMWNLKTDTDALVTEWMQGVYGQPAAKPMREWFDLLHAQVKPPGSHLFIYDAPRTNFFTPAIMNRGKELHDQADGLAATDLQREYLRKSRLWWRYVDLIHHPGTAEKIKTFIADCKGFGITQLNEGRGIDQWENDFMAKYVPKKT